MSNSNQALNKQYDHLRNLTQCLSRGQLEALNQELKDTNAKYPTMRFTLKRKKDQLILVVSYLRYQSFNINVLIPFNDIEDTLTLKHTLLDYVDDEHVELYILLLDQLMERASVFMNYYEARHKIDRLDKVIEHMIEENADTMIAVNTEDVLIEKEDEWD